MLRSVGPFGIFAGRIIDDGLILFIHCVLFLSTDVIDGKAVATCFHYVDNNTYEHED
jgi:hypothetical protein